jgi:FAD/FMN-containing dehydrogenase
MTKDIEREAFEKALAGNNIHNLKVCTIFDDEENEYFASDVCDPSEDHIVESINLSWRMWQAAKAHEAEKLKGCVVVPVEPTEAMIDAFENISDGSSIQDVWSAMIEAARGGNEH